MSDKRKGEIKNILTKWRVLRNTSPASKFRTYCFYGHPWIEENIYRCNNKTGNAECWTCKKERAKTYQRNKRISSIQVGESN